ncbi:MAG: DUF3034 family protein [Verrucomicrobiae bacterium]|nr:DUF3034 family protein [Verrucomicrobiae bacterium]
MKTVLNLRSHQKLLPHFGPALLAALLVATAPATCLQAEDAAAATTNAPAKTGAAPAEKPAPLPLHQIEGNGGIFSTLSAYIVNPPRNGEPVGRPSVGFAYVDLGHEINLEALTITESPLKRLELGYGWNRLDLGDLPQVLGISTHEVQLHNFNVRYQILKEGEFDQKWIPALTAGVHYKYNDGISDVNNEVGGALASVAHIAHHDGEDFTLYASKLFTQLPRPVLLELGGRATEGVWNGLGGFTSSYNFVFEGNVVVFVTDKLALAAEYKQQPRDYTAIGDVVRKQGDWWTIDAAYVVNSHLTLAVGYGHFGNVLNHEANGVWGITTKWEF